MTRAEHLKWAKDRALEYADNGDAAGALASLTSDLNKHPDTTEHVGLKLGMMLLMAGHLSGVDKIRKFIDGFN